MNKSLIYLRKKGLLEKANKAYIEDTSNNDTILDYFNRDDDYDLYGAFYWFKTEEGDKYWEKIALKIDKYTPTNEDVEKYGKI